METYSVYQHINKTNGKRYIGITKQLPEQRWGYCGVNYKNKSPRFWAAICKYGWDGFEHVVIKSNISKDEACELEIKLIKEYRTQEKGFGYNILEGGTAPELPEDVRAKMSRAMIGNKNGAGHVCSEEKKRKISEAQKGRKFSAEHKKALSEAKKGGTHASPSEETRKKISDSHEKYPVICVDTEIVYESVQDCARKLNLHATNVCKCCKGKLKTTGGYRFEYYKQ